MIFAKKNLSIRARSPWLFAISFIAVVSFLSLGCKLKKDKISELRFAEGRPDRSDKNAVVPKEAVKDVQKAYLEHFKIMRPDTPLSETKILSDIPRQFLNFDLYLLPRENRLAFKENYHFDLPRGGGVIDLKDYVTGSVGSFSVVLRVNSEISGVNEEDLKTLKVFFLSNSKRRQISGENFGSGCDRYLEMSHFYESDLSTEGVEVNATDQRYVSVLAGTFYFFLFKETMLFLGSVTFEDSRFKDLMCGENL